MENTEICLTKGYYHLCSFGSEGHNFIKSQDDYFAAFNIVGVCAADFYGEVVVLSFSIEDSHPHLLLYGTRPVCEQFAHRYKKTYMRHVVSSRGDSDGVSLKLEVIPVTDNEHLMRVGAYTVIQPTKDGKNVMPYDYPYGTGSMYFRPRWHIPIWLISTNGEVLESHKIAELSKKKKDRLLFCKTCSVPDDWLFCQGFLLPTNYIAVDMFEAIYKTHNCFRTFLIRGKAKDTPILERMAATKGVRLDDFEARTLIGNKSMEMFDKKTVDRNGNVRYAFKYDIYYWFVSKKHFGGITEDTAGFFLQVCEIVIPIVALLAFRRPISAFLAYEDLMM